MARAAPVHAEAHGPSCELTPANANVGHGRQRQRQRPPAPAMELCSFFFS